MLPTVNVPPAFEEVFKQAQRQVAECFAKKVEDPTRGTIEIHGERYINIRAASMSIELFEATRKLYADRGEAEALKIARSLLFDIAHALGIADAKSFHSRMGLHDPIEKLSAGPVHFAYSGWAFVNIHPSSRPQPGLDYFLSYDHPYSFEADAWIKAGKQTESPVCVMNAGYSSGWCTQSFELSLVAVELSCKAAGDQHCRFVMAPPSKIKEHVAQYEKEQAATAEHVRTHHIPELFSHKKSEDALLKVLKKLEHSEERLNAIVKTAADAIITIDVTGTIVAWNSAAESMFGYTEHEIQGKSLTLIVPQSYDGIHQNKLSNILASQESKWAGKTVELIGLNKSGDEFPLELTLSRWSTSDGVFFTGIVRNITQRKRMQTRIAQADRVASIGMLAAGIGHEINNPLAYVSNNLEFMANMLPELTQHARVDDQKAHNLAQDFKTCIEEAAQGTRRIRDIARDLRTFSRVQAKEDAQVQVNTLIQSTAKMVSHEIKCRAQFTTDYGEVPHIHVSATQICQVMVNLLLNAAQSIDEGHAEHHRIHVRTWVAQGQLLIEVSDTGTGIAAKDLPHLFDPFYTTKPVGMGSGLGLCISQNIITSYGGTIEVKSQVGKGTRMIVHLPLGTLQTEETTTPQGTHHQKKAGANPTSANGLLGRILVVDDERPILTSFERMLQGEYEIVLAQSGAEAINILKQEIAFDAIITDMIMPQISGMDLFDWISAHRPGLKEKMIFITGGVFTNRSTEYAQNMLPLLLEKPIDCADLQNTIRNLVLDLPTTARQE